MESIDQKIHFPVDFYGFLLGANRERAIKFDAKVAAPKAGSSPPGLSQARSGRALSELIWNERSTGPIPCDGTLATMTTIFVSDLVE
jgi:hypothetical protein